MATRSKSFRRFLYILMFTICIVSFLFFVVALIGATTLNSLSNYADPYFLQSNGYTSFEAFLADQGAIRNLDAVKIEAHMDFWVIGSIGAAILALMSLIYLVSAVGMRDAKGNIQLSRFDNVFGEFQLLAIAVIFFGGGGYFVRLADDVIASFYGFNYIAPSFEMALEIAVTLLVGLIAASLGLAFILSNAKKVKANHWLDKTFLAWIWNKAYNDFYRGGSMMRKFMLSAFLIAALSISKYTLPLAIVGILVLIPKWVHQYEEIRRGVEEVNSGNLDYKIPVKGDGELDELAEGINQITDAANLAVQSELKNQRMKTDLISNVSHDLKTPLTSMVTYIDLLKQEGLDSPRAETYLDILHQKTDRLCQLTDDLFEAAKASSGAMPVDMMRVDLLSLLNQGLGEMDDRIEASGLDFVINHPEERYFVMADGRLLWRVISNLLSNVFKYSQDGTRVYIDFYGEPAKTGDVVIMEMKNISRQSLNIDPEVLMERFHRGDASRTIEGSGLGLTIAKDLMKLMGGGIEIKIDGDLFKVKLILKAAAEEQETPEIIENITEN